MYRITELQERISKNLCVYTLQRLDGKPDEMRAVVDVNQDNHFRLLKYIYFFFFRVNVIKLHL